MPPTDAPKRTPNILLAPCAGRSADGYRLGQGGGYLDRALANPTPAPHAIEIGQP
ncbi:5-formyltetrahydrofolate cyclo-ligase [Tritonibacter mobilis]|uniref:5-formyltetrahydrofolate cyclo-ligase n=1 Tax=Tritonibacter mobilis TaxID=379347 RepID=UPI00398FCE63